MYLFTGLAIVAVVLSILAIVKVDDPQLKNRMLLGGLFAVVVDLLVEWRGITNGGWAYSESVLFFELGEASIPLELPLIFFSGGLIAVYAIYSIKDLEVWDTRDLFLVWAIAGMVGFLLNIADLFIWVIMPLGLYGLAVTKYPKVVIPIGILAGILDIIIEYKLVNLDGSYQYAVGGYDFTIAIYYIFGAWAIMGLLGPKNWSESDEPDDYEVMGP